MRNRNRHVASSLQPRPVVAAIAGILAAASAHAAGPAPDPSAAGATVEEVIVLGRGETRQVQSVSALQLDQLPAGTSPLKAIENLPGVNFQSADPFGAYEWSARVTVRGFNQNRLGFTLDGVPLGDMTYGNHNGLHISRAIPSEAVARVQLSQGAGGIDTASSSNLGGTVQFFSADPAKDFGVQLAQTFGSDSMRRTFAQLDTGELGSAGTRAYVGVVDSTIDKWKGGGDQQQRMYNLKVVQPLGEATLTGYYNYSDRMEKDYQDLSLDIVARRGWDWDNFYPNWNAAVAAGQACNASGGNDGVACDDAYWDASGLRKDNLGYLALALPINDALDWNTTLYLHKNEGQGLWGTPYTPTPGGAPLSIRTTEYDLNRKGVITALTWKAGSHTINGGVWYEKNEFNQARRFYGLTSLTAPTRSFEDFQSNPLLTQWDYDFDTRTVAVHLQDTWAITDTVRVNFGARSLKVENEATTLVGDVKSGSIDASKILPQAGINWALSEQIEAFGAVARNMRAFASSGTSGPFSTTAAGFNAIRDTLEPETSTSYEAGMRFHGGPLEGVVTAYHVDFKDRQIGINTGPGILGNPSVLANVGSVTANGIETALIWRPLRELTWFNSVAYTNSEYDDNYVVNNTGVPRTVLVKGKNTTDTPEWLMKSELSYDTGSLFARIDAGYTSERFYTYTNDKGVGGYTVLNAGVGYKFSGLGFVEQLVVQADVTNLTDKQYYSTIDSNGFTETDPKGTFQTLLGGAPRQFFVSAKAKF